MNKKNLLHLFLFFPFKIFSQVIPQPNKVVIVILENHSYQQIIDTTFAPYIDSIASEGALFSQYYALGYPSQPNYIKLFSGNDQGVINDAMPSNTPFTTPNLASSLIDSGFTFNGYAEDLDSIGALTGTGYFLYEHLPWLNWQADSLHQIPYTLSLPFSHFPSDYDSLPDLCFVIPNGIHDMHNGSDPGRITDGDDWIRDNLSAYINWCQLNNSLFILTFDEGNSTTFNRVPLIIYGPSLVVQGVYPNYHDHYGLLCTLENMFSLGYLGNDSTAACITECWQPVSVSNIHSPSLNISVIPNPASKSTKIIINYSQKKTEAKIILKDSFGKKIYESPIEIKNSKGEFNLDNRSFAKGIYFLTVYINNNSYKTEKIIFE